MTQIALSPASRLRCRIQSLFGRKAAVRISGRAALSDSSVDIGPLMEATRQAIFAGLLPVANRHGLHVAPEVSLAAVFTIQGRGSADSETAQRALRQKRVDFLLIDGSARPILAIDCVGESEWRDRALRRDRLKRQAFEKAQLPLLELMGGDTLEDDLYQVEALLEALIREGRTGRRAA